MAHDAAVARRGLSGRRGCDEWHDRSGSEGVVVRWARSEGFHRAGRHARDHPFAFRAAARDVEVADLYSRDDVSHQSTAAQQRRVTVACSPVVLRCFTDAPGTPDASWTAPSRFIPVYCGCGYCAWALRERERSEARGRRRRERERTEARGRRRRERERSEARGRKQRERRERARGRRRRRGRRVKL